MTAVFYHSSYRTRCFYRPFVINVIVFWNRGPQSGSVKKTHTHKHTHTHTRAHINTHPHPLWRRFNERIPDDNVSKARHCTIAPFFNESGKRIFFKAILYYWCKCSISTYWNEKRDVFSSKKKKDVTIQQQYICTFSTSNFKCHSCTFNRTRALTENSICKLWKRSPFFFHNISRMPTFFDMQEKWV